MLKKVYFPTYRYSEDIYFTLLDDKLADETILEEFESIFADLHKTHHISLGLKGYKKGLHESLQFMATYIGPLGGLGKHKKVKVSYHKKRKAMLYFNAKKCY